MTIGSTLSFFIGGAIGNYYWTGNVSLTPSSIDYEFGIWGFTSIIIFFGVASVFSILWFIIKKTMGYGLKTTKNVAKGISRRFSK